MSRACSPTWESPISPSISARGINAATDPHDQFLFSSMGLNAQAVLDEGILDVPHDRGAPRHFLYVGDDEPRKNLARLKEAHDAILYLGGMGDLTRYWGIYTAGRGRWDDQVGPLTWGFLSWLHAIEHAAGV